MSEYSLPEDLTYVPIRFMDEAGFVSDHPPGRPVVRAALRHDPDHGKGARLISGYHQVHALLDTGADHNYATAELIESAECPQIGTVEVHGATSSMPSTHHLGHIFFPEIGKQFETDVCSATLRNSPATEHMIIGMLVIKHCRLVMDFKAGIYRLYMD